jgi:hypothetical protein
VLVELQPPEVGTHDFVEHPLAVVDDHQVTGHCASNCSRAGRMRCIGTPLRRIAISTAPSAKPTKGMIGSRTARRVTVVRIGASTTSRRPGGRFR